MTTRSFRKRDVVLREVGLRDGLQLVKDFPSTAVKQRWIAMEHDAGIRHFEVGSFVPADRFPQFADVAALIASVKNLDGALASVLAVNKRGMIDALASGADEVTCVLSATEAHSMRNAGRSRQDTLRALQDAVAMRDVRGAKSRICAAIAMAFGCSIAGEVAHEEVIALARQALAAGADAIGVADTVGYAGPAQVAKVVAALRSEFPDTEIGVHLHDTRGMGIANVFAAVEAGASTIDASLGGLGGCPFAPGATGNVVMEDVAFLFRTMGIATGIDVERLIETRKIVEAEMPDEQFQGHLAKAGL